MPAEKVMAAGGAGPLAGRTIVVTRPAHQAAALTSLIEAAGGKVLRLPLLEIEAATDPAPLDAAAASLASYSLAIFISPNAVAFSLPRLRAVWPASLAAGAIGPGTVQALAGYGIDDVLVPAERFDSEGLLELPALQAAAVAARKVAIFRGDGGRDLLGETLRARGATVDYVSCYRRRPPAGGFAALAWRWAAGEIDALTVSSSEGLRYLVEGLGETRAPLLAGLPLFAPHPRIIATAKALGFHRTHLTAPADAGLLAGLCAYNWPAGGSRGRLPHSQV